MSAGCAASSPSSPELDAEHADALPHAGKSYQILIRPEGDDAAAQVENDRECPARHCSHCSDRSLTPPHTVRLSLTFAHPPTYPDVPPLLRARRRVGEPRRAARLTPPQRAGLVQGGLR